MHQINAFDCRQLHLYHKSRMESIFHFLCLSLLSYTMPVSAAYLTNYSQSQNSTALMRQFSQLKEIKARGLDTTLLTKRHVHHQNFVKLILTTPTLLFTQTY